jgi:hypothetical protein
MIALPQKTGTVVEQCRSPAAGLPEDRALQQNKVQEQEKEQLLRG